VTIFVAVFFAAQAAEARERLFVYIAASGERELAENLSELTIAKLAESGEFELVGANELELGARDVLALQKQGLGACVEVPACLAEVSARARVRRAILGRVLRVGSDYELALALVRTESSEIERRSSREGAADVAALIVATQTAAGELMAPAPPAPPAPLLPPAPPRALAPPLAVPEASVSRAVPPAPLADLPPAPAPRGKSTSISTIVGFTAAGLAVVSFSAAAVQASAASSPPGGVTRKQRQEDLEHRKEQAKMANVLFVSGGVLSAVAIVSFVWP
jgi:hypothetical protein